MSDEDIGRAADLWLAAPTEGRYPAAPGSPPRPVGVCLDADLIALELADRHLTKEFGRGIANLSECREKVRQKWQQKGQTPTA